MNAQTVKVSSKRQISIPKAFTQVKEGDTLLLISEGEDIVLKPLEEVLEVIWPAIMSQKSLEEDWNSPEDEEAFAHLQ